MNQSGHNVGMFRLHQSNIQLNLASSIPTLDISNVSIDIAIFIDISIKSLEISIVIYKYIYHINRNYYYSYTVIMVQLKKKRIEKYLNNKTKHSYVPYSRPNGWTEWAEIFCGHSWVVRGCLRLKKSNIFFNFLSMGNARQFSQYHTYAQELNILLVLQLKTN